MNSDKTSVLFTTTIPIESIFAAGLRPVDLNNRFISRSDADKMVEYAEQAGFPRSSCAWIKGLYTAVVQELPEDDTALFVAVTEGDCSNAGVLSTILATTFSVPTYLFSYNPSRNTKEMRKEISRFSSLLGTTIEAAESVRAQLSEVRSDLRYLDELTWKHNKVSGFENHLWLVSASDFNGNVREFHNQLLDFIEKAKQRTPFAQPIRVAYLGVPPIFDIYHFIEEHGGRVVFNEMQREFAMVKEASSLEEQYCNYTYPYSAPYRFSVAIEEIKRRKVDAVIHYVQSFCHRHIEDIVLRNMLQTALPGMPLLTLEGDKPQGELDGRVRTRIEAFLETAGGALQR